MSGPLPAPPSVSTSDGSRLVISGAPTPGAVLTSDGPGAAHWAALVYGKPADQLGSSTLLTWVHADAITGLADGANLVSWVDSASIAARSYAPILGVPKYRAVAANGKPCVDFRAGSRISCGSNGLAWSAPIGLTVFAVINIGAAANQTLFEQQGGIEIGSTSRNLYFNRSGIVGLATSLGQLPFGWAVVVITLTDAGTVITFDINGMIETFNVGGNNTWGTGPAETWSLGGSLYALDAQVAEFGMYTSVLPAVEITALKDNLRHKYIG